MKKILIMLCLMIYNVCGAAEPPITLIVPFAAGGPMDIVGRIVQQGLTKETGRVVNVIYKPGAAGAIGVNYAIEQRSTGTMLLLHSSAFFTTHLLTNSTHNLSEEFKLISPLGYHPFVLIANEKFQYQDVKQWKKLKEKRFSIGSGGRGTASFIANQVFEQYFPNISFTDVAYGNGTGPMANDVMTGTLDVALLQIGLAKQLTATGKVRALAVANKTRLGAMPDVPTFQEVGVNKFDLNTTYFVFATSSTNESELMRMRAAMTRVLEDPETRASFKSSGVEFDNQSVNLDDFITVQLARYTKILKNIK